MLKTFSESTLKKLEYCIEDYARTNRLSVDSFSIVYNGVSYEALVKFKARL